MQEGTRGEAAGGRASTDPGAVEQSAGGLTPRQIDVMVESILGQLFATTGRFFSDRMVRLEEDSSELLDELEGHRERLEEEIAERAIELREIRRRIEAERTRSAQRLSVVEGLRDLQRQFGAGVGSQRFAELAAASEPGQEPDQVIASAQRVADELVSSAQRVAAAQRRAEEVERDASERRSAVMAESEALEQQLRDLDARISRLLSPSAASAIPTAAAASAPTPAPSVDEPAESGLEPPRESGEPTMLGVSESATPVADTDEQTVSVSTIGESDRPTEERDEPEADTAEVGSPATTTVVFHGVRSFQAALGLERTVRAIDGVLSVRVAEFDDRRLTFAVIHTLGGRLSSVLAQHESLEADLLREEADRVELQVRA